MTTIWKNWSGNVSCQPEIFYPTSDEDILRIFEQAKISKKTIRPVGSGHSFTALCQTNDWLVSLDKITGLIHVNTEKREVTVKAGTKLHQLGKLLHEHQLALENMGDIDVQSVAGAFSTGTHGTGLQFGTLATQITALKLITPQGQILHCSERENPDIFKAAQISLGALGIITEYTIRCKPAYKLQYRSGKENIEEVLNKLETYNQQHRNFEFYWFPYTQTAQTKFCIETDEPVKVPSALQQKFDLFMENDVFGALCTTAKTIPSLAPTISKIVAWGVSASQKTDYSYKVYATPRTVRFCEMEYNIPIETFKDVKKEMMQVFQKHKFKVPFPTENRFVKEDDIWLSPAYNRKSAYIAIHQYKGMDYEKYFKTIEEIFVAHGGRPHWGKLHFQNAGYFEQVYPQWTAFQQIRQQTDSDKIMLNEHLRRIFEG